MSFFPTKAEVYHGCLSWSYLFLCESCTRDEVRTRQPCGHITVRGTAPSLFGFWFLLLPSKELLLPADKHFGGHSMTVLHSLLSASQHLAMCAFVTSDSLGEWVWHYHRNKWILPICSKSAPFTHSGTSVWQGFESHFTSDGSTFPMRWKHTLIANSCDRHILPSPPELRIAGPF